MKPKKPKISKERLTWKWDRRKEVWEPYHRVTWTEGGKRKEKAIKLNWGGDAKRLDELYWQCERGEHQSQKAPSKKLTWHDLIVMWRSDPVVQKALKPSTKKSYRQDMDRILEKNGGKDVRNTTRAGLKAAHRKMAHKTRMADRYLTAVSLLWNYAKSEEWPLGDNPAEGIKKYGTQNQFLPWPEWMVEKLDHAPEVVRTACNLILNTGQRPGAAIIMKHAAFRGEWMDVLDEKGGEEFEIYCPAPLREYMATVKKTGDYVLAKNLREPMGYNVVEKAFSAWRGNLGQEAKKYSMHGLRKLAIIRLAEAGATDAQIQSVTNQSFQTIVYYRQLANRKALSKAAMTHGERL